jgi:hypothetical protein
MTRQPEQPATPIDYLGYDPATTKPPLRKGDRSFTPEELRAGPDWNVRGAVADAFRRLARRAMVESGSVLHRGGHKAVDSWLSLVHEWFHRSGNARFALEDWRLVLPFEASAEYCAEMSTQASERGDEGERKRLAVLEKEFRDASRSGVATAIRRRLPAEASPVQQAPPLSASDEGHATPQAGSAAIPKFPGRASWLAERLRERAWNKHDVYRQGGPDHKSVQKILDGKSVREDLLHKLAAALSKANASLHLPEIIPRDIPTN